MVLWFFILLYTVSTRGDGMKYFFIIIMMFAPISVWSEWEYREIKDKMTDQVTYLAKILNSDGHGFSIYRIDDNNIRGAFILSESSIRTIESNISILYRVDDNPAIDFSSAIDFQNTVSRVLGKSADMYVTHPRSVNFRLWVNDGGDINPQIVRIMNGDKLLVRYFTSNSDYVDTLFSLNGASDAIKKVLNNE